MNFEVLTVGTSKDAWLKDFLETYEKKINQLVKFKFITLKSPSISREKADYKIEVESKLLLKSLRENDLVVLLDEKGRQNDTQGFAKSLQGFMQMGRSRLVFVVGGPFGASEELKKRADHTYSLSALTLSHQVAITVLLEQMYRALCIWRGIPYHNP